MAVMGFVAPPGASVGHAAGHALRCVPPALCNNAVQHRAGTLTALAVSAQNWLPGYHRLLVKSPILTKAATASVLGGAGDVVAQLAEAANKQNEGSFSLDTMRLLSMISFCLLYTGLFQSWWINELQESVHFAHPLTNAVIETVLCQFVTIPLIYMPAFFLVTGFVRGMSLQASLDEAKEKYFKIYVRNVCYWFPVQMVQFAFVPEEWQITFLCTSGFIWSVILSTLALSRQSSTSAAAC